MIFKKTVENFVCAHCGNAMHGEGYTNHCSQCLWSKHVDVNPGDRSETCAGLMEPSVVEQKRKQWRIYHVCQRCGFGRWNMVQEGDNFETLVDIMKKRELS